MTTCPVRFHTRLPQTPASAERIRCCFRQTRRRSYFEKEKLLRWPSRFEKIFLPEQRRLPIPPNAMRWGERGRFEEWDVLLGSAWAGEQSTDGIRAALCRQFAF